MSDPLHDFITLDRCAIFGTLANKTGAISHKSKVINWKRTTSNLKGNKFEKQVAYFYAEIESVHKASPLWHIRAMLSTVWHEKPKLNAPFLNDEENFWKQLFGAVYDRQRTGDKPKYKSTGWAHKSSGKTYSLSSFTLSPYHKPFMP